MKMFRKRYVPEEIVDISSDYILERNENIIVTKWKPINPREDIGGGISYIFLKRGYKISKIFDAKGKFIYWYCDIIETEYNEAKDEYVFTDLLVDLKVYADGKYEVLDFSELTDIYKENKITKEQLLSAIKGINTLIEMVQNNSFPPDICNKYEYQAD